MTKDEMNKELIEKLTAIREALLAFQALAQAGDVKKLAELVKQKVPTMVPNYSELLPYMTLAQRARFDWIAIFFLGGVEMYLRTGKDRLTGEVMSRVPQMLADLDDIERAPQELLEKLVAIREDLTLIARDVAFTETNKGVGIWPFLPSAAVADVKKLAELVKQKAPMLWSNYEELIPYMTADQKSRAIMAFTFKGAADGYLETGTGRLTGAVRFIPQLLADLDGIAKKLEGEDPKKTRRSLRGGQAPRTEHDIGTPPE